jgi:hypothetical protein
MILQNGKQKINHRKWRLFRTMINILNNFYKNYEQD